MKIALFVPRVHFYAPTVLSRLIPDSDDRFLLVMTPKIGEGSGGGNLRKWIQEKGIRYLFDQACLRILYKTFNLLERGHTPIPDRNFPEVTDFSSFPHVEEHPVSDLSKLEPDNKIKQFQPDVMLSIFFNQIIPGELLSHSGEACLNLHPGPLPNYRGFSPVFWQLLNNEQKATITLHHLTPKLDAGTIVDEKNCAIRAGESYFSLYRRLAYAGSELVNKAIESIRNNVPLPSQLQQGEPNHYSGFTRDHLKSFYNSNNHFWCWDDFK